MKKDNKNNNNVMVTCCEEINDECFRKIKCGPKDSVCITKKPRCRQCSDTDSEYEDALPETSTEVNRRKRRSNDDGCIVSDLKSLETCYQRQIQSSITVDDSNENCPKEITYSCVKKREDCHSSSTPVRPRTRSGTRSRPRTQTRSRSRSRTRPTPPQRVTTVSTTQHTITTSSSTPTTSTPTTIRSTTQRFVQTSTQSPTTTPTTIPTSSKSFSVSTSTLQPNPSLRTSTTGNLPRVSGGNQKELSSLDTSSIVGIAIGSMAFLVLIIIIAIIFHRKRKAFKLENNKSLENNVGNSPHYFTIDEIPNNQYEQINDVNNTQTPPVSDYNILGQDISVKTNGFDDYNHISPAVANGQGGLGRDGYNHIVVGNDSCLKILDKDYNHIKFETGDYNQLRGHNSFKNPKAESYHHILRPSGDRGTM